MRAVVGIIKSTNIYITLRFYRKEWNDGDDGYDWKSRYLGEKRNISLQYLSNVSKRTPIHDAIRERMNTTVKTVSEAVEDLPEMFSTKSESSFNNKSAFNNAYHTKNTSGANASSNLETISKYLEEVECDETMEDMIKYVDISDAKLLTEELLSGKTMTEHRLIDSLKQIRENRIDDYKSYAAVPPKERSL